MPMHRTQVKKLVKGYFFTSKNVIVENFIDEITSKNQSKPGIGCGDLVKDLHFSACLANQDYKARLEIGSFFVVNLQ